MTALKGKNLLSENERGLLLKRKMFSAGLCFKKRICSLKDKHVLWERATF